jgi:hypothetical protein
MKLNSTIAAIVLGLGTASVASATNYIYITGSTAARGAVYNSLAAGVGFDSSTPPSVVVTYGNANPANGSYMEFVGTIGGVQTIVKASWSGSEAGISDVSGSGTENFLADPGTQGVLANGNSSSSPTAGQLVASAVNLAMADNALTYSRTPSSTAVQQGPVVVVPFVFVKNNTPGNDAAVGSTTWTNITADQFKAVATIGTDVGLFLGTAKTGYNVYLAGRDNLSGTRVNVYGETGFGITKSPNQIELTAGAGNPATTSLLLPAGNAAGNYYTTLGQSSGGTLAKSLGDTSSAADLIADPSGSTLGFYVVSYLGLADDATAEGSPYFAHRLTYNGVAYSTNAVQNGSYAIWGNEYVLSKAGSASNVTGLQSALATKLQLHTDGYEIPLSAMVVNRTGPTTSPSY